MSASVTTISPQRLHALRSKGEVIDLIDVRTKPEFVRVTNAGMAESHVHDVQITKEAPNYRV